MRVITALVVCAACGGNSSQSDPPDAPTASPDAYVPVADVHYIGRFDAMHRFAWPGTQIRARFEGTSISADLDDSGDNYFDVTVDGTTSTIHPASGRHTLELASGLAPGTHELVLSRRTESFFGATTFYGFSGATLVPSPVPTRMIEFIGDSITCGYGVLGQSATCSFSNDTEAETHAWGTFASAALGVVHTSIAYSGTGVYRNYGGSMTDTLPARYDRLIADDASTSWDFSYTPDVIVVNLGTNDFSSGDPGTPYVTAYVAFLTAVRGHYANAPIVLATSPMLGEPAHTTQSTYLDQVIAMLGDAKVTKVDLPTQLVTDGAGCDFHPNEVTQQKMADQLVPAIRAVTGW